MPDGPRRFNGWKRNPAWSSRPGRRSRGHYRYRNQWGNALHRRALNRSKWLMFDDAVKQMVSRAADELQDRGFEDADDVLVERIEAWWRNGRALTVRHDHIIDVIVFLEQWWHLHDPEIVREYMVCPRAVTKILAERRRADPTQPRSERVVLYLSDRESWNRLGPTPSLPDRPVPTQYGLTPQDVGEA